MEVCGTHRLQVGQVGLHKNSNIMDNLISIKQNAKYKIVFFLRQGLMYLRLTSASLVLGLKVRATTTRLDPAFFLKPAKPQ